MRVEIDVMTDERTEFGWDDPYIEPPTPEEVRAAMPPLARWRFNTMIDSEAGLRDKINTAIAKLPEPQRTIARNKLADVVEFIRIDTLFDLLGADPDIGKTPEDIDTMWWGGLALT